MTTMPSSSSSSSSSSSHGYPSVVDFLEHTLSSIDKSIKCHVAIGNPAGDADSIISSIGSAYIDTILKERPTIPIISIPIQDLQTLRPETKYLLSLAGVTNLHNQLISIIPGEEQHTIPEEAIVTLVDHNQLVAVTNRPGWIVETILDHHVDEQAHQDSCTERMIAFDKETSQALVASTCTLLVERWQAFTTVSSPMPATLAILLLGVILIDSINLLPNAGKVTPRDTSAVHFLRETTPWGDLSLPPEIIEQGVTKQGGFRPDHTKLFETLQSQKFQASFWSGLTAYQALNLDYKTFSVGGDNHTFGVSSVLQSMDEFLTKANVSQSLVDLCFPGCDFVGVMFLVIEKDIPRRQLLLASPHEKLMKELVMYLEKQPDSILQPTVVDIRYDSKTQLHLVQIEQGNPKASRKQLAPILMEFYN